MSKFLKFDCRINLFSKHFSTVKYKLSRALASYWAFWNLSLITNISNCQNFWNLSIIAIFYQTIKYREIQLFQSESKRFYRFISKVKPIRHFKMSKYLIFDGQINFSQNILLQWNISVSGRKKAIEHLRKLSLVANLKCQHF